VFISFMAFAAVFSIVVLVHEFGHFIIARKAGVKVREFSIGFPFSPILFTLFRHRETEFTVRLLPLGGFVSFSEEKSEGTGDLFGASYLTRALIMSAGSISNIICAFLIFVTVFILDRHLFITEAVLASTRTVWAILYGSITIIFNLLSGHGSMEGLAGPVGIATIAGQAAAKGLWNLIYFTGVLSISLGVMNLLPLPALDGGQLSMLLIEAVRKKPLSLKTYRVVNLIGLSLLIILTVLVTYKDITKLMA